MTSKNPIHTPHAPAAIGPYSQAVVTQSPRIVYLSGQLGVDPATGHLVSDQFDAQVTQAFKNLQAVAQAAGGSLAHAVKLTLYLTDLSLFAAVNEIMSQVVPQPFPARSTIGVASLPKGAIFEVDAVLAL